jgi:hypothetical protein
MNTPNHARAIQTDALRGDLPASEKPIGGQR